MNAVLQPHRFAARQQRLGAGDGFLPAQTAVKGAGRRPRLARRQQQYRTRHRRIQLRRLVFPQGVDDTQVVFPAQAGLYRAVVQDAEIGQHGVNHRRGRFRAEPPGGDDPFPHHRRREAGKNRRRHILPGLLRRPAGPRRRLNGAAVHKDQAGRQLRLRRRQLQGHIGAPGMAHDEGPPPAQGGEQRRGVAGHAGEVVARVHLRRAPVSPLVRRRHPQAAGGQARRHQIPDVAGGRQAVQQQNRGASAAGAVWAVAVAIAAAPVPVVESEAAQVHIAILGVREGSRHPASIQIQICGPNSMGQVRRALPAGSARRPAAAHCSTAAGFWRRGYPDGYARHANRPPIRCHCRRLCSIATLSTLAVWQLPDPTRTGSALRTLRFQSGRNSRAVATGYHREFARLGCLL